jgi:hypothetical protein
VLDGRALWVLTLQAPRPATLDARWSALALKGRAEPIFWDGEADPERTARDFTIWLSDDPAHTPLRLVMPLAVGEVRVDLAGVERTASAEGAPRLPSALHPRVLLGAMSRLPLMRR